MAEQKKSKKPMTNKEKYPNWEEIRASWTANKKHCDPNSSSARKNFIEKGIEFDPLWLGEIGYLRYYLFCVDNGYISGQSKLLRIDENKGFSPNNCYIAHNKSKNQEIKPDDIVPTVKESESITNIINNYYIIDNVDAIKALLTNVNGHVFN
ncbi:MAG: hypothetical protein VR72_17805 [Clostridiaceae bacterium BRH_c20a]|nr:MAG: hypothetical protein VR72_17805 [Clostridiaceae bacterium BRH_c20a]